MNLPKHTELTFQLIVESAPGAMILVNKEGKITFINTQTEKLFGYSRHELLGQNIETLIPYRHRHRHVDFRDLFMETPRARAMGAGRELFALRKNGTEFPVEIGLNPLETSDGPVTLAAIVDLTERKKAEERFRLVVESAPNAMVLANAEGKITLVNSQTEKLFGYSREELIDSPVEILIPLRHKEKHPGYRGAFVANPQARSMGGGRELFARRKDGSEFPVEIGLNPLETTEGPMVLAAIIDITERKMQEANRLKSDFLANMSHELRTPLNAILGFSELLVDKKVGDLNDKQIEYLQDIHASGSHLLQLINDILDIAKIESGKSSISIESFSIAEITGEVIKVLQPLADKKQIKILLTLSNHIDQVSIDKNKFRQILYNLISNAIKFNHTEGIIRVETAPQGSDAFELKVSDTGIGISKENIKKLFIPFVQLDSGTTRKHEGSGLGLALTKNIVTLQNGTISLESSENAGTTFFVTLPLSLLKK